MSRFYLKWFQIVEAANQLQLVQVRLPDCSIQCKQQLPVCMENPGLFSSSFFDAMTRSSLWYGKKNPDLWGCRGVILCQWNWYEMILYVFNLLLALRDICVAAHCFIIAGDLSEGSLTPFALHNLLLKSFLFCHLITYCCWLLQLQANSCSCWIGEEAFSFSCCT